MEGNMTQFNNSNWARAEFSQQYRDNADIYIVERHRMLVIMKSFYRHFLFARKNNNVLDLGCGDGIITHNLLEVDGSISATLIDASEDMLNKAKERLKGFNNTRYIHVSFQDVMEKDLIEQDYDFVVSSMAIHHLTMNDKKHLFEKIYSHLHPGGYFLNIDVALAPSASLDEWYMKLWEEWMDDKRTEPGAGDGPSRDVIKRYKDAEENQPDTLEDQLNALKEIGFKDIDCYYKYGIFAVYGGRKQGVQGA
jgi:tRNA (cmo5U34)-methyltransferase